MIQITNLQKKFGEKIAVNIDNYTIGKGEMLGLVGNNGAGKLLYSALSSTCCKPTKAKSPSMTST